MYELPNLVKKNRRRGRRVQNTRDRDIGIFFSEIQYNYVFYRDMRLL